LEGTPRERGRIHGERLRPKILSALEIWKKDLENTLGKNVEGYIRQFVEETGLVAAVKKWTPHLLEEVEGIAEGAEVDFNTIFAWNCPDEEWTYRPKDKWLYKPKPEDNRSCSSLGVSRQNEHPTYLAMNTDGPEVMNGAQVLLHIKDQDSSLESFVFTLAGVVALNGMNNQPIGSCCNTIINLNYSHNGLPVAFVHRGILEQPNLESAVKFMKEIKHASGQNYILGDKEKVVDLECSSKKVSEFVPYEGASRVYHTNHPLANDDEVPSNQKRPTPVTSIPRFELLESELKDTSRPIDLGILKSILRSHKVPTCRHEPQEPTKGMVTLGSQVMVLSDTPEYHTTNGPPCFTEYKVFKF
jgi:isopenicillin-N N-acyltransferase-like protein